MTADKKYVVPFANFVEILQEQYDYLLEGGTSYRQRTAELSLEVAHKVGNVNPFYDKIEAEKEVKAHVKQKMSKQKRVSLIKNKNSNF